MLNYKIKEELIELAANYGYTFDFIDEDGDTNLAISSDEPCGVEISVNGNEVAGFSEYCGYDTKLITIYGLNFTYEEVDDLTISLNDMINANKNNDTIRFIGTEITNDEATVMLQVLNDTLILVRELMKKSETYYEQNEHFNCCEDDEDYENDRYQDLENEDNYSE